MKNIIKYLSAVLIVIIATFGYIQSGYYLQRAYNISSSEQAVKQFSDDSQAYKNVIREKTMINLYETVLTVVYAVMIISIIFIIAKMVKKDIAIYKEKKSEKK